MELEDENSSDMTESDVEVATDELPSEITVTGATIDFMLANGSSLFSEEDGRNDSSYHPPRSGRRNDAEQSYTNLEAEYGTWKNTGDRQRSIHLVFCSLLYWSLSYVLPLYCFVSS